MVKKYRLGNWERIYQLEQVIRPYVPFTSFNTVRRYLVKEISSILDVGCGTGGPARVIRGKEDTYIVGIDIFLPSIELAKKTHSHDDYIMADVRNLPARDKTFDLVTAMEILEHLDKEEGLEFIHNLERIARRQIIITTPVGKHSQDTLDGNPHQVHKHIWLPEELKSLGFKVRGHGIRDIGGLSGMQSPVPKIFRPLLDILWVLVGPLVYFAPKISGNMVCIKKLD
jgi:SAM-dependent methyltransferase